MAASSLNNNTWYAIQNLGTQQFIGEGSQCVGGVSSASSYGSQFQFGSSNGSYFLRNRDNGMCLNAFANMACATLEETCDGGTLTWNTFFVDGKDTADGYYFTGANYPSGYRLYADPSSDPSEVIFEQYTSGNSTNDQFYAWTFSSVAAINDPSYSTYPGASSTISSNLSTTATSTSTSSTTTMTTPSTTSSTSTAPLSTSTVVVTGTPSTVTATPASTSTQTVSPPATSSPSVQSDAASSRSLVKLTLLTMLGLSLLPW